MVKAFIITDSTSPGMTFSASQSGQNGSNNGVWLSEDKYALKFFSENDALSFINVFLRHYMQVCRVIPIEMGEVK